MKAVAIAILSGALFFLSQGLADIWLLGWIAAAPLLWFAYGDAPRWQVLITGLGGFSLGQLYLLQCYWGRIPATVILPLVLTMAAAFALTIVLSGEIFRRGQSLAALIAFPALWTTLEFAISKVSPHGSFGALGYAQVSFPAAIQVAALFGVHAVTFVLCLFANAVALILRRRLLVGSCGVAVCILALTFGFARLTDTGAIHIRVAALADPETRNAQYHERTSASELAASQTYASEIRQLRGIQVVAIPEGAVHMQDADGNGVLAPLAAAARASGSVVIVGTVTATKNRAFALLPGGTFNIYEKRHLLAPFETEIPGHDSGYLGAGYATQICKDMDFASSVRTTAEHGVRLMVVPADDFGGDRWIHARIAIMRGVENGFAVLRSAFDGLETISDAQGRLLASASTMQSGMIVIQADAPLGPGPTLYTRIGDIFPWLCAILAVLAAAVTFLRGPSRGEPVQTRDLSTSNAGAETLTAHKN